MTESGPKGSRFKVRRSLFVFALACFALPFVNVGCNTIKDGVPTETDAGFRGYELIVGATKTRFIGGEDQNVGAAPNALVALGALSLLAGAILVAGPGAAHAIRGAAAGLAALVALVLTPGAQAFDPPQSYESWNIGFQLALALSAAAGGANAVAYRRAKRQEPAVTDTPSRGPD